jgi:ankyrin repeat protein
MKLVEGYVIYQFLRHWLDLKEKEASTLDLIFSNNDFFLMFLINCPICVWLDYLDVVSAAKQIMNSSILGISIWTLEICLVCVEKYYTGPRRFGHGTPLHLAAKNNHRRIVKLPVEEGASLEALDERGMTPVEVATHHGATEVANWFSLHATEQNVDLP